MKVSITGATGLIGTGLVAALRERGDTVTVLSRNPDRAAKALGVEAHAWDPGADPAPAAALAGRDAVVHLAGEPVAQRWNARVKQAIRDSREIGTRYLLAGLEAPITRNVSLFAEGRWTKVEDTLKDDFEGFGKLDLSGRQLTAGISWRL